MSHHNCNHDHDHSHDHGHFHENNNKPNNILSNTSNQIINTETTEGKTSQQNASSSLFNAIRYGLKAQATSILIESPDIVNELDSNGCSCVHWAAKRGDIEMLQILCDHGASVNIPSNSDAKMRPIHWAASDGKITSIAFLLNHKEDINVQDGNGCTPVTIATQHNYHQCVVYLIKNGADMSLRDNNGDTALHWAAYKGYTEMVGLLAFLTPNDLDSIDTFGQTPMHLAALRGNHESVEYLARECRADMKVKDKNGNIPLDLSIKKSQLKVEWVLRQLSYPSCLQLVRSLSPEKLKDQRVIKYLTCGYDEREISAWPWRVVFLSNSIASFITISFAMNGMLADLYSLHLFNIMTQMLWWIMFLMCLFKTPSYVIDHSSSSSSSSPYKNSSSNNKDQITSSSSSSSSSIYTYEGVLTQWGMRVPTSGTTYDDLPAVCHSCHVCKPIRSKHCKVNRRCINKFDHYCPFVYNTICRDNYKYFVGLLIMHVICGTSWFLTTILIWRRMKITWMFFFYMFYSFGWYLMIWSLLAYHLDLIRKNLTTNEHVKYGAYAYMKNNANVFDNPFDRGTFWKNFLDAMFPSQKVYYSRHDYLTDKYRTGSSNSSNNHRSSSSGNSSSVSDIENGVEINSYISVHGNHQSVYSDESKVSLLGNIIKQV